MKILLCDDEETVLSALSFKLSKDGFEVVTAADGKQAMEAFNREGFDLVLTDVMIPFYSGLELVAHIRKDPVKGNTPVILLSGIGLEDMVTEAFQLGANDFVTKPFSPNELVLRIRNQVRASQVANS